MELKIVQINAQRSRTVAAEIRKIVEERKIDILLIQEPYTYKGKVKGYGSINVRVLQNAEHLSSKAAIVIYNETITVTQIEQIRDEHIICAHLKTQEGDFYVTSIYCQYSHGIEEYLQRLEDVMDMCRGSKMIIAGDVNAKSVLWHSDKNDIRGDKVEEFIETKNLIILNKKGQSPTFSTVNGEANIDVTLVTNDMASMIKSWSVKDDWCNSDHNIIYFEIISSTNVRRKVCTTKRYKLKTAKWQEVGKSFKREFGEEFVSKLSTIQAEDMIKLINKKVHEICKKNIKNKKQVERNTKWWNREIAEMRKKVNLSRKNVQKYKKLNIVDMEMREKHNYTKIKNKYNCLIRKAKTESWENFVTEVGNRDPWGAVYKLTTGKIKNQDVFHTIKTEGTYTTEWKSTIKEIIKKLVPEDEINIETHLHKNIKKSCREYKNHNIEPPLSIQEIDEAIKKMKDKKAPGDDNINPEIVRCIWHNVPKLLEVVFNTCLIQEKFPEVWKKANLKILPKAGNRDPASPGSYRPISLLPVMGKIYERLLINRILVRYKEQEMDNSSQFGFKAGLSTEDAIDSLLKHVETSQKKYVVGIFLDIQGAFDNLWWFSILHRIKETHCSSKIYNVMCDYFKNREVMVTTEYETIKYKVKKGCPQGSIIGPMVWTMVMDELLMENIENCNYVAYADDLVALIHGDSRAVIEETAKQVLSTVEIWTKKHKLQISSEKTKAMLLKGNLDKNKMPSIKFNKKNIKFYTEVKYLGIIIDKNRNFVQHAKYIKDKTKKIGAKLKRVVKAEWGLNDTTRRLLYQALILPVICYGAGAWFRRINHTHVRRQIDAAQRFAMLSLSRACRTVSTAALQVITGNIPLDLVIVMRGLNYMIRKKKSISWMDYETPENIGNLTDKEIKQEKLMISKKIIKEWQKRWNETDKGRVTYQFIPDVEFVNKNKKWFHPGMYATFLLTGHGTINSKLYQLGKSDTKNCWSCVDKIEDIEHMILQCEQYENLKEEKIKAVINKIKQNEMEYKNLIETKEVFKEFINMANKIFQFKKMQIVETTRLHAARDGNATI